MRAGVLDMQQKRSALEAWGGPLPLGCSAAVHAASARKLLPSFSLSAPGAERDGSLATGMLFSCAGLQPQPSSGTKTTALVAPAKAGSRACPWLEQGVNREVAC